MFNAVDQALIQENCLGTTLSNSINWKAETNGQNRPIGKCGPSHQVILKRKQKDLGHIARLIADIVLIYINRGTKIYQPIDIPLSGIITCLNSH